MGEIVLSPSILLELEISIPAKESQKVVSVGREVS